MRRKRLKPRRSTMTLKPRSLRTVDEYYTQPERFRKSYEKALSVLSKMRSAKISLQKASKESGVHPSTVKRLAGSALQKSTSGKWAAKPNDRLFLVLVVPTSNGTREIAMRGSRQASLLGKYWNSVHRYLETGDRSSLDKFRGKSIRAANGEKIPLLTERAELRALGLAGALSFESLYARSV